MATKKRNFGNMEKKVFVDILKKYKQVIENKDTDGAALRAKNAAWEQIAIEFNGSPYATSQVTRKQLRRLWMNLKQRQRTAITKERHYCVGTGSEPSISDTYIESNIVEVAPELILGIDNAIDSDSKDLIFGDQIKIEPNRIQSELSACTDFSSKSQPTQHFPPTDTDLKLSILLPSSTPSATQPMQHPNQPSIPLNSFTRPHSSLSQSHSSSNKQLSNQAISNQKLKNTILERESRERQKRAEEIHMLEKDLLHERIREAKAKADLAEFLLHQKRTAIEELKMKIKNIRTTYNREASKVAKSKKSGAGKDDIYRPQLIWFSVADRFLKPVIEGRNSKDNMKNSCVLVI
ncbi:hypothetical protein evm_000578 [Chilo suppressalis]|nr:hypothetical protein evm_000578 [Chilo suppressalis]